jgi:hypothetical protein
LIPAPVTLPERYISLAPLADRARVMVVWFVGSVPLIEIVGELGAAWSRVTVSLTVEVVFPAVSRYCTLTVLPPSPEVRLTVTDVP